MKTSRKKIAHPRRKRSEHLRCPTCGGPVETPRDVVTRVIVTMLGTRELERILGRQGPTRGAKR